MKRNDVIQLRVSPEEKQALQAKAAERGQSVSELIRGLVILGEAHEWTHAQQVGEQTLEVGRVAKGKPRTCPRHPDAGKLKSRGRTYCAAPLCHIVLAD